MSQKNVERVIGLLATDEALRRRFAEDSKAALESLAERGVELTAWEMQALAALDRCDLAHFAGCIDPRLQKTDPLGGM